MKNKILKYLKAYQEAVTKKDKILKCLKAYIAYQFKHYFWLWMAALAFMLGHVALAAIWVVAALYFKLDDIRCLMEWSTRKNVEIQIGEIKFSSKEPNAQTNNNTVAEV